MSAPIPTAAPAPPARPARVRLRAATRRVPRARAAGGDADEEGPGPGPREPEPNMKLSRALVVMLLLHVVAVGGAVAFGMIKDQHQQPQPAVGPASARSKPVGPAGPASSPAFGAAGTSLPPATRPVPLADPFPIVNPGARTVAPSRAESDALRLIEGGGAAGAASFGPDRTYTVGRGETVSSIAQKLKLRPEALLRANDIDDPRKIQVGQKLRLPPAAPAKPKL